MWILIEVLSALLRPSFAILGIVIAVSAVSFDNKIGLPDHNRVEVNELGCGGLFKPICHALSK